MAELMRRMERLAVRKDAMPLGAQQALGVIKEIDESARSIRYVISTGDRDREGDTLNPMGCEWDNFIKNPVVLWAHQARDFPIARGEDIARDTSGVYLTKVFATAEQNPRAEYAWQLAKGGFIRACSVGFLPIEWVWADSIDPNRGIWDIDYRRWELLESSLCSIPANPYALEERDAPALLKALEPMLDTSAEEEFVKAWQVVSKYVPQIFVNKGAQRDEQPQIEVVKQAEKPLPDNNLDVASAPQTFIFGVSNG